MAKSVSDSRLATMLRKYINTQQSWREKLNGIYLCGSRVSHQMGVLPAVFLLTNNDSSIFVGNMPCRSPWACPICTPKVMAKKARDIACAIDALSTWYKQDACMITFTLPHTANMSAEDTFTILRNTRRSFFKVVKSKTKKYELKADSSAGKKGEIHTYDIQTGGWGRVRNLGMDFYVNVYEFTWGENGFHPHIHGLFWLPRHNFQKVGDFEEELNDVWWRTGLKEATKYFAKKYPEKSKKEIKEKADNLYSEWRKSHPGVTISRNEDGSVRVITSSMYLDDWSGDDELTKHYGKKAQDGHFTPYQLLTKAAECEGEEREHYLKVFIEYAKATRGRRRVEFAKHKRADLPQISKIIAKWKETQTYVERLKKKYMGKAGGFRLVCWFKEEQWSKICFIANRTETDLRSLILERAHLPDGKHKIQELLLENGIDISQNGYLKEAEYVEKLFNEKVKQDKWGTDAA